MPTIERQPLPAPNARPITEDDRAGLYGAIGRELNDILSGSQAYYPEGIQKSPQEIGENLSRFVEQLKNFRDNYVIDPSNVLGPMVDKLDGHAKEFNGLLNNQSNDPIEIPEDKSPDTRDNGVIHVEPFPGPETPPNPLRRRLPFYDASSNDKLPDQPAAPAPISPLGIYSGKPMRQWIVPPPIWRRR